MIPRPVFAAACSLLLLGSTAVTALAHDGFPTKVMHSTAPQVHVVGHITTYWAINHDPARDNAVRQLTLRVTGSITRLDTSCGLNAIFQELSAPNPPSTRVDRGRRVEEGICDGDR